MAASNSTRRRPDFIDLTGRQFGKWTVVGEVVGHHPKKVAYWLCRCECGTEKIVRGSALTGGRTHGCKPCSKRQHGMTGIPEYVTWQRMNDRCHNPKCLDFPEYGGRGITICDRWRDFAAFYADMGPRPTPAHSIDRIDNALGYCPENCRWATPTEQARNRSYVRLLTFQGTTLCLMDWAAKIGIGVSGLHNRLAKGWSLERALTTPPKRST